MRFNDVFYENVELIFKKSSQGEEDLRDIYKNILRAMEDYFIQHV